MTHYSKAGATALPRCRTVRAQAFAALIQTGTATFIGDFLSTDLSMLHSGGSDIGGAIGAELTDDALNNLWDDVSAADANAGDTEFHCVYVKNIHPATSVANVKVRIDTDPAESNFEIGKGAAGRFT